MKIRRFYKCPWTLYILKVDRYQDKEAYFGELDVKFSAITDATDYGFCCLIIPQVSLSLLFKSCSLLNRIQSSIHLL